MVAGYDRAHTTPRIFFSLTVRCPIASVLKLHVSPEIGAGLSSLRAVSGPKDLSLFFKHLKVLAF